MSNKRIILGLVVASLLLVAAVWLVREENGDGSPIAEHPLPTLNAHWAQLARIGEEQLRSAQGQPWPFAAFRGEGEEMPEIMRRAVSESLSGGQPLHLRFDHAYRFRTATGTRIWVVRGKGVVCVIRDVKGSVACDTDVNAARRGLVLEVYKVGPPPQREPTQFLMLGIVRDRVRAVRIRIKHGPPRTIPVVENTFSHRARSPMAVEEMIR